MFKSKKSKSSKNSVRNRVIVFIAFVGILLFGLSYWQELKQKEFTKTTVISGPFIVAKERYTNTTYGFTMKLPNNWSVCEGRNGIWVGKNQTCGRYGWDEGLGFFIHLTASDIPYPERKEKETFLSWVKKAEGYFNSFPYKDITVKAQYIDKSKTHRGIILVKNYHVDNKNNKPIYFANSYYIELVDSEALTLGVEHDGENRENGSYIDKVPLDEFAGNIEKFPISTGDILGAVGYVFNNEDGHGSAMYENYQGEILKRDKKTKAARIQVDGNSQYLVRLPTGTYYFIYPDGKEKKLVVRKGQATRFDIDIAVKDKKEIDRIWDTR